MARWLLRSRPVRLAAAEPLVATTPFLGWRAATAAAGVARVELFEWQMLEAVSRKARGAPDGPSQAALAQRSLLTLHLAAAWWSMYLSELVFSAHRTNVCRGFSLKDSKPSWRPLDGSVTGPGHPQASTGCVGCMARLTDPRIDLGRAFSGSERLSGAFSVGGRDGRRRHVTDCCV